MKDQKIGVQVYLVMQRVDMAVHAAHGHSVTSPLVYSLYIDIQNYAYGPVRRRLHFVVQKVWARFRKEMAS